MEAKTKESVKVADSAFPQAIEGVQISPSEPAVAADTETRTSARSSSLPRIVKGQTVFG
jgi:hypothetical protein